MADVSYNPSLQTQKDKFIGDDNYHTKKYTFTINLKKEENKILPQARSCNHQINAKN